MWDIETNIDAATRTLPEGRTELTWDRSTRSPIIPPLRVHRDSILSLAFSKDNKTLVSGSKDGTIILWDISKRQAIGQPLTGYQQLEFDWNNIEKIGFNQDSNVLVIMNKEGANLFWNLRKNEQLNQPFSDAILWNNPKEQYKPNAKEKQQLVKTVSQDGKISASANGSQIILGDVATNQPIGQPLLGTQSPITHLAFSPDSKMLISISEDSVMLWNVSVQSWQAHACQMANRLLEKEEIKLFLHNSPTFNSPTLSQACQKFSIKLISQRNFSPN